MKVRGDGNPRSFHEGNPGENGYCKEKQSYPSSTTADEYSKRENQRK